MPVRYVRAITQATGRWAKLVNGAIDGRMAKCKVTPSDKLVA